VKAMAMLAVFLGVMAIFGLMAFWLDHDSQTCTAEGPEADSAGEARTDSVPRVETAPQIALH
jgi:hypothetical protein